MAGIATIRGTAIVPGVSRNGRLYTKELLAAAAADAQERIDAGDVLEMLTHHGAEDDSTRIVGRLTAVRQRPNGSVAFAAELADTEHGRDIAKLVTPKAPFLKGVSIRGYWDGPVRTVQHEGQSVQTGDVLVLDGLDFTKSPGVVGAGVEGVGDLTTETADGRVLVYESVAEATAAATKKPYGDVKYADPGYRDGVKRYPIDTVKHARAAWAYINKAKNAGEYTAQQLKRIKARIKAALKGFGVDVTAETAQTRLGDVAEYYPDTPMGGDAGFCIDAWNGPLSLTMRACGIDPAELRVITQAAMDAAIDALQALDPDMDADIDVPGTEGVRPNDDDMETTPAAPAALAEITPTTPAGASPDTQEVPAVSEPQTPAAETATTTPAAAQQIVLTNEQFALLLAQHTPPTEATPAAPAAPAAPATPTAPAPVAETEEQRLARLITAGVTAAVENLKDELRAEAQATGPRRTGIVVQTKTSESDIPTGKAFHELPPEERDQLEQDALLRHFNFAK